MIVSRHSTLAGARRHNFSAFMGVTGSQLPASYRTCLRGPNDVCLPSYDMRSPGSTLQICTTTIDNISSGKYTIHYRATNIYPCFYHRLNSSFAPFTGHSLSSSQIPRICRVPLIRDSNGNRTRHSPALSRPVDACSTVYRACT